MRVMPPMRHASTNDQGAGDGASLSPPTHDAEGAAPVSTASATSPSDAHRASRISLALGIALLAIAAVWVAGAVWSFGEQTRFAENRGFDIPQLLPGVLDGFAFAMAAVAWASSLDGRSAMLARIGTIVAIGGSAASNGAWAWQRSGGDAATIALALSVPVVSNLAFEVLLSEVRRQVQRSRGLPAPVPVPAPRLIRLVLSPWATYASWRRLVLAATDPRIAFAAVSASAASPDAQRSDAAPEPDAGTVCDVVAEAERITASATDAHRSDAPTAALSAAQRIALPAASPRPQRITASAGEVTDADVIAAIREYVIDAHHAGTRPAQREMQRIVSEAHPGAPKPGPRRLGRLVDTIRAA